MNDQIDKLTNLGTEAVETAIGEYTQWYATQSVILIALGAVVILASVVLFVKRDFMGVRAATDFLGRKYEQRFDAVVACVALSMLAVGVLLVVLNAPTAFNPRAYAIHQLIQDAR